MNFIAKLLPPLLAFAAVLGTTAPSCQQSGGAMDAEAERALRKAEKMISRRVIAEGEFWGLRIEDSKRDVVARLIALEVDALMPDVQKAIVVTKAQDLPLLANAEGLIWFPGHTRLDFSGDRVFARAVDPRLPYDWTLRLNAAKTRAEVFAVFAEILAKDKRAEIGNYARGARWIKPAALSKSDWQLLEEYDTWKFAHDDGKGFWNLRLNFASGRLADIHVWHSPVELP